MLFGASFVGGCMSDYNEMMLNKHLYQLDADSAKEEAIGERGGKRLFAEDIEDRFSF